MPATVTEIEDAVDPPGFHIYVTPVGGVAVAVRVTDGVAQLIVPLLTVTVGGVGFPVTVPHAVAVQPLDVLVTVTQYVPATVTEIEEAVEPPGLHK